VFQQERISVEVSIDETIPTLEIDYDRIVQVFLNILSNAAKYCEKGNGKVWITASQTKDAVHIAIADNGPGVKEDMQQIIFEKFFQAKNQTMRKPKGSGLGLAISKKIIQLHEGKIGVTTRQPNGSIFTFSIPKQQNL
jgi:signal transduction histidine kinase